MAIEPRKQYYHIECDECSKEIVVYVPYRIGSRNTNAERWHEMISKIKRAGWRNMLIQQRWYNYCPDCLKAKAEVAADDRIASTELAWLKDEPI